MFYISWLSELSCIAVSISQLVIWLLNCIPTLPNRYLYREVPMFVIFFFFCRILWVLLIINLGTLPKMLSLAELFYVQLVELIFFIILVRFFNADSQSLIYAPTKYIQIVSPFFSSMKEKESREIFESGIKKMKPSFERRDLRQ